ncbi:MAG: fluoride efflux transporter FluC [Thermoleophilaceae bacterium]
MSSAGVVSWFGLIVLGALGALARVEIDRAVFAVVGVGFLGGYTTFSAFQLEVVSLAEAGHASVAGAYVATSILLGLLLASAASALRRGFTARRSAQTAPS